MKEAKEWIQELVLDALPMDVQVPAERILNMRWVLTWKIDPAEDDGRRPKARLVILGDQDPDIVTEESYGATATRASRQLCLQRSTHQRHTLETW